MERASMADASPFMTLVPFLRIHERPRKTVEPNVIENPASARDGLTVKPRGVSGCSDPVQSYTPTKVCAPFAVKVNSPWLVVPCQWENVQVV